MMTENAGVWRNATNDLWTNDKSKNDMPDFYQMYKALTTMIYSDAYDWIYKFYDFSTELNSNIVKSYFSISPFLTENLSKSKLYKNFYSGMSINEVRKAEVAALAGKANHHGSNLVFTGER